MPEAEASIVINRPVEDVFEFTSNYENDLLWGNAVAEAERTSEGPPRVGSTGRLVMAYLGWRFESTLEVTQYELNRLLAIKSTSGKVPYSASWAYEPVEGGTKFTYRLEVESGLFGVFGLYAREMKADLERLKTLLESEHPPGSK